MKPCRSGRRAARRARPLWGAAGALLVGLVGPVGPPARAQAATCRADKAGVELFLELVDADEREWAPWCARLADFLELHAPLPPGIAPAIEARLSKLDYFSEVACRTGPQRLLCRMRPEVMVVEAEIAGKLPLSMLREDIRRRLFLRSGTLMPRPAEMIAQQEERLVKYLVGEGYLDARVHISLAAKDLVVPNLGVSLVAHVEVGPAFHVAQIHVEGAAIVADPQVRRAFHPDLLFGLGRGRFRPLALVEQARELEEKLQAAGYVGARVRTHSERVAGAPEVDLHVSLAAGPWLKLSFRGNRAVSSRRLAEATTFRAAGAVDSLEVETSRLAVLRALQEAGYDQAQVTAQQDRQRGPVRLTFHVSEGPRRWLDAVRLELPAELQERTTDSALRRRLAIEPSYLLGRGWVDQTVARDEQALTAALRALGYARGTARAHKQVDSACPAKLTALFTFELGPHDAVEGVTVVGLPADVREGPLLEGLGCRDGGPYVAGTVDQDVGRLQAAMVARGYLNAEVAAHQESRPTPSGTRTAVTFHVSPGVRARYQSLLVRGRVRTKIDVIEDEVRLRPGAPLESAPITQTRRRLLGFNIFSNLTFTPQQASPDNPNTQLLVGVQEREDQTLDGMVGFSTDDFFALGASYNDRNLWGRALNLTADARLANAQDLSWLPLRIGNVDRLDLKLNAFHPWGAPFDTELGASAAYMDYVRFNYRRVGGTLALVRPLLEPEACRGCPRVVGRLAYELSTATLDEKEVAPQDAGRGPSPSPNQASAATIGRLVPSFTVERRDSSLDPHSGYFLSSRFEWANPYMTGPLYRQGANFWRFLQRAQAFYPIVGGPGGADSAPLTFWGGPLILAATAEWDAAGFFSRQGVLPASESFAYGGDYSVRGLSLRGAQALLGDNNSGRFMLTASCELRWYLYRIGIGTLQLAGFVDYGSVSEQLGGLLAYNTVTAGPALRYVTQVGPLTLAYGHIVAAPSALRADHDAAPPNGRFHFMFGYSF